MQITVNYEILTSLTVRSHNVRKMSQGQEREKKGHIMVQINVGNASRVSD